MLQALTGSSAQASARGSLSTSRTSAAVYRGGIAGCGASENETERRWPDRRLAGGELAVGLIAYKSRVSQGDLEYPIE